MNQRKREALENKGWVIQKSLVGLFGITENDEAFIDLRYLLAKRIKEERILHGITKGALGKRIKKSAADVGESEAGRGALSQMLLLASILGFDVKKMHRLVKKPWGEMKQELGKKAAKASK